MEPSGLAFGKPKDRLREIRDDARRDPCLDKFAPHFASAFALRASADSLAESAVAREASEGALAPCGQRVMQFCLP
jgi:hypothetical protein